MFTRRELTLIKYKSLRTGLWFKALNKVERAIINLTIKYVRVIKSPKLMEETTKIVGKLMDVIVDLPNLMRKVGRFWAYRISKLVCSWGNLEASRWGDDPNFAGYLVMTKMNIQKVFRCV